MDKDIEIMAKTMFGEARGEYKLKKGGIRSLIAIGNVIINRSTQFGISVVSVCLKPKQFSCWNNNDPNREIIRNVTLLNKIYEICFITAKKIICGELDDITYGSNHYYSKFMNYKPYWSVGKEPTIEIGNHLFFKL